MMSSLVASQSGEMDQQFSRRTLTKYAWLSIAAAVITIVLKMVAWRITGSVGLFSDAAESIVNLVAAVVALTVLIISARPADKGHQYGHTKAEYFSAVTEGAMIFVAAGVIIVSAALRFFHPKPLESIGIGLIISVVATLVNGGTAFILLRGAKKYRSITLKADGKHLMTDVYTTVGVLVAVGIVALTHWYWMDPLIAIAVGINGEEVGRSNFDTRGKLWNSAIASSSIDTAEAQKNPVTFTVPASKLKVGENLIAVEVHPGISRRNVRPNVSFDMQATAKAPVAEQPAEKEAPAANEAEQPVVDNANNAAADRGERRIVNNGVGTRVPMQSRRN